MQLSCIKSFQGLSSWLSKLCIPSHGMTTHDHITNNSCLKLPYLRQGRSLWKPKEAPVWKKRLRTAASIFPIIQLFKSSPLHYLQATDILAVSKIQIYSPKTRAHIHLIACILLCLLFLLNESHYLIVSPCVDENIIPW